MGTRPWYGITHAEIEQHAQEFLGGTDYYGPSVPLTSAQISLVDDAANAFFTAQDAKLAADQAQKQAQADFIAAEKAMIHVMQTISKVVRSKNPSEEVILGFGMPLYSPSGGTGKPVTAPNKLSVTGTANGNVLRWSANGNAARTIYTVEAMRGGSSEWVSVHSLMKTQHTDTSFAPGEPVYYRIRASRGNRTAVVSTVVAVYPELAAA